MGEDQQKVSIYISLRDKDGNDLDDGERIAEIAAYVLWRINGGATKTRTQTGYWRRRDTGARIIEPVIIVYSYIEDWNEFALRFQMIRKFIHWYGRKTNQDAVMFNYCGTDVSGEYSDRTYFIENYDAG